MLGHAADPLSKKEYLSYVGQLELLGEVVTLAAGDRVKMKTLLQNAGITSLNEDILEDIAAFEAGLNI